MCQTIAEGGRRCSSHIRKDIEKNAIRLKRDERILEGETLTEDEQREYDRLHAIYLNSKSRDPDPNLSFNREKMEQEWEKAYRAILKHKGDKTLTATEHEGIKRNLETRDKLKLSYDVAALYDANENLDGETRHRGSTARALLSYHRKKHLAILALQPDIEENINLSDEDKAHLAIVLARIRQSSSAQISLKNATLGDLGDYQLTDEEAELADRIMEQSELKEVVDKQFGSKAGTSGEKDKTPSLEKYETLKGKVNHYDELTRPVLYMNQVNRAKAEIANLQMSTRQYSILTDENATQQQIDSLDAKYHTYKTNPAKYNKLKDIVDSYDRVYPEWHDRRKQLDASVEYFSTIEREYAIRELVASQNRLNAKKGKTKTSTPPVKPSLDLRQPDITPPVKPSLNLKQRDTTPPVKPSLNLKQRDTTPPVKPTLDLRQPAPAPVVSSAGTSPEHPFSFKPKTVEQPEPDEQNRIPAYIGEQHRSKQKKSTWATIAHALGFR